MLPDGIPYLYHKKGTKIEEEMEIMQFTGLFDKNGKEIYEGDIVKTRWEKIFAVNRKDIKDTHFVEITKIDFKDVGGIAVGFFVGHDAEVIGNIYEHPHLLTPPAT